MFHTKNILNRMMSLSLLASVGFAALLSLAQTDAALAATAPNLGTESTYGVVSSTFTNSNTPPQTIINGAVCYTTPPDTPPLTITGATVVPCPPATGVDQLAALAILNGQLCVSLGAGAIALDSVIIGGGPPGTFPPGCYSSGGAMDITLSTTVTLNGAGVYIFRPGGALTTGANSRVSLVNGACASDVFWAPVAATTLGANAALSLTPTFVGNILDAAGITIGHFANLEGRALAFGGTVTTDANTITVPTCLPFGGAIPTLGKGFIPSAINAGDVSTLTITLSNPNTSVATLSAQLTDTLPLGVVIAATPNASTTCGGGATVTATAGGNTVTLPSGATIPAGSGTTPGTCTVTVDVTAATAGSYINTLAAGALQTNQGNNAAPASATLTVAVPAPPPPPPTAIPTLNEWGVIIFMVLVGLMSIYYLRRQKAKA